MSQNVQPGDESPRNALSDKPLRDSNNKEQPNIIDITKEFIRKTSRSKANKDSLMSLLEKHDQNELDNQEFFNKVHVLDDSLTNKAFVRVKEIREQMSNPDEIGKKHPIAPSLHKRSSSSKPRQGGQSSSHSPTKIADEAKSSHQKFTKEIQSNRGKSQESNGDQNEPSLITENNDNYINNGNIPLLGENHHSQSNGSLHRNEPKSDTKKRVNKSERKSAAKNFQDDLEKRSNLSNDLKKSSGRMSTRHKGVKTTNYREMQKGTQPVWQLSDSPQKRAKTIQQSTSIIEQKQNIEEIPNGDRRPSLGFENDEEDLEEEQGEDEQVDGESGEQEADEEINSAVQSERQQASQNGERNSQFDLNLSEERNVEETDLQQSLPRKAEKPISRQKVVSKNQVNPYQMVLDRKNLRNLIKQKMQVNGFYNFQKQSRDQIVMSVDDTERLMHEVVKTQLQTIVKDLVNTQRSRFQQWKIHQHTLPNETTTYEYVSQNEQMRHNWQYTENQDPRNGYVGGSQIVNNTGPPQKQSLEMVTIENVQSYQRILENEEKKRSIMQEEQRQIRDRAQKLATQQAQNDKLSDNNTAEKKVEEDSDLMIDPDTGKKMTKKKIKEMHSAGTLTSKQIAEFQTKGLLQPPSNVDSNLQQSRRQQELQQLQGSGKQNDLGYHMLKVQNRLGKLDQNVTVQKDQCDQNPENNLLQDFVKVGAGPRLNLQVLESKGDFQKNDTQQVVQKCDMAAEYLKNATQYIQEEQSRPGQPYHPMQFREAQDQVESLGKDLAMPKDLQQKVQMRDVVVYLNQQIQKGTESKSQSNSHREILYEILNSSKYV